MEKDNISLEDILEGVVKIIPPAWQYPEVTCACIDLKDRKYRTPNYKPTEWKQIESIIVNSKKVGTLEVYYLEEKPTAYEGPFLKEERDLVHGIAERLGHIIESKKAEAALQRSYAREKQLRKKLQSEMQNRMDFTRQLVHEIKTPLTALLATSQLMLEETRKTRLEKVSGYVYEGANNLNARIDELQDVTRGELGKLKLEPEQMDIQGFLSALVEETQALSSQHGVSINLQLKDGNLPPVFADPQRVRQIMLNLINNACKYASSGKRITIKASQDLGSRVIIIEVRDYGPGVPKDKRRVLFRPGYQLASQTESKVGLGIGLTLCKMLVELHGGQIWLESVVGEGSSFIFTLPCENNQKSILSGIKI